MIASLPLALALSVAFLVTGAFALLRATAAVTGRLPSGERTTESAHLLMSASMLVMTWTWFDPPGPAVQAALFTVFAGYFAVRAVRRWRGVGNGCAGGAAHALMSAAMVWMLVSMPLVMTMPGDAAGGHAGHAGSDGMSGMSGMDMGGTDTGAAAPSAPAGWAVGVTLVVCLVLVVTCGYWTLRALRRAPAPAPVVEPVAAAVGAAPGPSPAPDVAPAPDAAPVRAGGPIAGPGARPDAACHALMSLGMIVMLAAMIGGW